MPTLDELANMYVTDKGTLYPGPSKHGYAPFYDEVLNPYRNDEIRFLEIGVCMEGTIGGHSIYMWRDYFIKAKIFTFDIVDMSAHDAITSSNRIHFYQGDQSKREDFESMYKSFGEEEFNFVLEDGLHTTEFQMISLAQVFKYVKSGGIYFLEDVSIPGHPVCCIRNDETYATIEKFIETKEFISPHITEEEKQYLEQHIEKIVLYTDVQDAYVTAAIYKK